MGTTSGGRRWGWIALLFTLSCGGGAEEPNGAADPIAPGAEAPMDDDLAEVSGDWALATVFFQLERWPEVRDAFRSILASEPPEELRQILSGSLTEAFEVGRADRIVAALNELRGVDGERPMVVRFGETDDTGLEPAIAVARRGVEGAAQPTGGVRHVLAVPATDPDQLEPALRRAFEHICREDQWQNGTLECRGWPLHLEAESRWVFVVFGSLDEPLRGSGEASETLRWAMDVRWPGAVHFRHSGLRGMAIHDGLQRMRRFLRYENEPRYVREYMARQLSRVVAARARTSPHRIDLDEAALAIRSSPAALLFVGHLTPHATDALARDAADPPSTPERTERQHLELRSALPLRVAARAVEPPFAVGRDTPQEAMRSVFRCGPYCFFGALAQPLGGGRLLTDLSATELFTEHVRYVHDSSLGEGGFRAHLDLAQIARVEGGRDARKIAALFPALHLDARVQGATVAGAIGVRPRPVFEVPPLAEGERSPHDPAQLRCLEQLEVATITVLEALQSVSPSQHSALLERGKSEATAPLSCITDPELRAEAESFLEALDAIATITAPPPPPEPQDLTP